MDIHGQICSSRRVKREGEVDGTRKTGKGSISDVIKDNWPLLSNRGSSQFAWETTDPR